MPCGHGLFSCCRCCFNYTYVVWHKDCECSAGSRPGGITNSGQRILSRNVIGFERPADLRKSCWWPSRHNGTIPSEPMLVKSLYLLGILIFSMRNTQFLGSRSGQSGISGLHHYYWSTICSSTSWSDVKDNWEAGLNKTLGSSIICGILEYQYLQLRYWDPLLLWTNLYCPTWSHLPS